MSTDWDVESYRSEFESDEHWELRKTFMLAHKERIPEDEIVCLAQVFTNIEFLGCRYPEETMRRVAELAKGIVESYREKKKNCLKRTFVAASDAASAKVKGSKRSANEEGTGNTKKFKTDSQYRKNKTDTIDIHNSQSDTNAHNKPSWKKGKPPWNSRSVVNNSIKKFSGPFSEFVLFLYDQEHPVSLLTRNAGMNKCSISWKFDPQDDTCTVYLNNELIGEGKGSTNKASKELAARDALQKLQDQCYTVKIKAGFVSDSAVSPTALGISPAEDTVIKCDIGEQIMKLMGWGGGGLGAKQQGIVEPVSLLSNTGRGGLGLNDHTISDNAFRNKAADYIREWMRSDTDHDLVFTSDFTIAQRKILHEIALRFSLKSKSYGKGDDRHLVLSRKPSLWQIVEELARVGGATSKYELIIPDSSKK